MGLKYLLIIVALLTVSADAISQRVQRAGVEPIDVSKNKKKKGKKTAEFTIDQFSGKWQEVARENRAHESADIKDTLFINFISRNEVFSWEGMQPKLKGSATIDPPGNILSIVADVYTIISADKEQIVLFDQDKYIHRFKKMDLFYYETLGKLKVTQEAFADPVAVSYKDIAGKWNVYRKQAKPGAINPPTNIVSKLTIEESADGSFAKGEITYYVTEETKVFPCKYQLNGNTLVVTTEENTWTLKTYKADGKEFVFGDADVLLYYSKPFTD